MSEELPIPRQGDRSDEPAVIEWGTAEPTPRRRRIGTSLAGLGRDPRLPLLLAGLGAVAGFASLVGEWLVITLQSGDSPEPGESLRMPAGVSDVGGFGTGYLVVLLALVCAVTLALRGTPAVRSNARLAGLTLAGALLALLVAATVRMDDPGLRGGFYFSSEQDFQAEYGRGLVMAFVACVLFAAALRLAPAASDNGDAPATPGDADGPTAPTGGRGWRRRLGRDPLSEDGPPSPADLTVTPATPFARPDPPA